MSTRLERQLKALTTDQIRSRIAKLETLVTSFHELCEEARANAAFTAAVAAMKAVSTHLAEIDQLERALKISMETDPYRRLLMLRDAASADASHVAAARYESLAAAERDRMTRAEEERRRTEHEGLSLEELIAIMLPAADTLPRAAAHAMVERLLDRDDLDIEDFLDDSDGDGEGS